MTQLSESPMPRDARAELLRLINGFQASQAIHVAATLAIADLLRSGPRTSVDLAAETKTHPDALFRLMRTLAAIGVFREDGDRFALTPLGEFLRSDVAGTHAPMAAFIGRSNYWQAWGDLLHAVRTGGTAFDHVHGKTVWQYRAEHPEEAQIFDRAMGAGTERYADAVLDVFDFSRFDTVVDIGGGDGSFLAKILRGHPSVCGILFDQPHIVARPAASIEGLAGRCEAIGGDFFAGVPQGCDAYLLKWILHNWDDQASIDILRACGKAMNPSGRVLVVEHVVGPPNTGSEGKFMDLTMMVGPGGRERTHEEFADLFSRSGFELTTVIPTATPLYLIEGVLHPGAG